MIISMISTNYALCINIVFTYKQFTVVLSKIKFIYSIKDSSFFEEKYPEDTRPREAIRILREWLDSGIEQK
jgi:hypothetical protein